MNVSEPAWTVRHDETTRTVRLAIDAPAFVILDQTGDRTRTFRPTDATVTVTGGVTKVTVRGPVIRKDGSSGLTTVEAEWDSPHSMWSSWRSDDLDTAPEWIRRLVAEVIG